MSDEEQEKIPGWRPGDYVKCTHWSGSIFRPGNTYRVVELFRGGMYAKIETETKLQNGKRNTADIPYYMVGTHFELVSTVTTFMNNGAEEYEEIMASQEVFNGP